LGGRVCPAWPVTKKLASAFFFPSRTRKDGERKGGDRKLFFNRVKRERGGAGL